MALAPPRWQASSRSVSAPTKRRAVDLGAAAALGQLALAAADPAGQADALQPIKDFFFDSRLQYDANGNMLLDPSRPGEPLPDNLWTQYVAVQATLIERLDMTIRSLGVEQSFGTAVILYTLGIRTALYPIVKSQLETTAKIKVLTPRVNELKEQYKDDEDRLNQEVGLLYMDLQIDPLGAIIPLLVQLPIFWGLYRGVRRLGIVEYDHLKEPFLWIPSLYGPNFAPDPSFEWLTKWQGPLIELHPKMGWTDFGLYAALPLIVVSSYAAILSEAANDDKSPAVLKAFPFLLGFITCELPQAMGLYIATNIASSVALTQWTTNNISSKIPGYDEYVKTGKWPAGVDPEKVLAKAFGVTRLTDDAGADFEDPKTIPEAIFSGRADHIPVLMEEGKSVDEFDDRGIPASAYSMALDNTELLERLFELGADPMVIDKKGNCLLHYMAGYGRASFLPLLLEKGLGEFMNRQNEDKQTPLDVARVNLQAEKVADLCRPVIEVLEEAGAEGNTTTKEDEARFEEMREQFKKEAEKKAAKEALRAMARMAEAKKEAAAKEAAAKEAEAAPSQEDSEEGGAKTMIEESLERVKSMDLESLRERLGGMLSEDQLQKVMARLEKMTPEQLARYASGLPSVKEDADKQPKAEVKESVLVD